MQGKTTRRFGIVPSAVKCCRSPSCGTPGGASSVVRGRSASGGAAERQPNADRENKMMVNRIAALYVLRNGPYYDLDGVDPWGLPDCDAREYRGPYPVVAHPPCARWGRYWSGGPMLARTDKAKKLGDDGGCFEHALWCVRRFGGVLEHPEASHAWKHYGLIVPPRSGGWVAAGDGVGWTCCVEQGHYGHPARKATWLYAAQVILPPLKWGSSGQRIQLEDRFYSADERRRAIRTGRCQRLSKRQRAETPIPFRDLLIGIARAKKDG